MTHLLKPTLLLSSARLTAIRIAELERRLPVYGVSDLHGCELEIAAVIAGTRTALFRLAVCSTTRYSVHGL